MVTRSPPSLPGPAGFQTLFYHPTAVGLKQTETFNCLRLKQRQTIVINCEAEVGRGLPEGWTAAKCCLLFLPPAERGEGGGGAELSNDKMSTFSRLWQ